MARKRGVTLPPIERIEHVKTVINLLLSGAAPSQIQQYAIDKEWNLSRRTIVNYIQEARESIQVDQAKSRHYRIAIADHRLEELYSKSIIINDYKTALAVVRESNTLFGLYDKTPAQETGESAFIQLVESAWEARKAETTE